MKNSQLLILNKFISSSIRLIIFSITILLTNNCFAQQFNNWYFPNNAGITFNTNPPSPLLDGQAIYGSSATISNASGNLLFYSDGQTVYNEMHLVMTNGDSLKNSGNQSGGIIILPFWDGSNKYYLFNSAGLTYGNDLFNGYTYNIIDMDANSGLGTVLQKNIRLGTHNSSEKLAIAKHRNGVDAWLITRDRANSFYTYKITCTGIDNVPIISTIGINTILDSINNQYTAGVMKASPDGNSIAAAYIKGYTPGALELYRFDNATGVLSDLITVDSIINPFGLEFTKDSRLLYATYVDNGFNPRAKIYQINVSNFDSAAINNSKFIVSDKDGMALGGHGSIQMGPDNKIYVANVARYSLDVINNPDVNGTGCNYVVDQVDLGGRQIWKLLPFTPTFLYQQPNVQISYIVANDCRTVTLTGKTYIRGSTLSFKWLYGDGDSSIQNIPVTGDTTTASITHFFPPGIDTFFVKLLVTSDTVCGVGKAIKAVVVKPPKPSADFSAAIKCNSLQVQFTDSSLLNFNPSISYVWQFGNGQTSRVKNPLVNYANFNDYPVTLIIKSPLSCVAGDTATKMIRLLPKPTAAFNIENSNCINRPVNFISAASAADSIILYKWIFSSVDSLAGITVSFTYADGGNKTVKHYVQSANGCASDTSQKVFFIESTPLVDFINTKACVNQPVYFTNNTSNTFGAVNNYTWQFGNGQINNSINPSTQYSMFGDYTIKLIATTSKGCIDSISKIISTINIKANAGNDTAVFAGSPFTLNGSGGYTYLWQPASLLNNNLLANPVGRLQSDQQFILTVSNNDQCTSKDSINIKILKPVFIPNAFTPNGDGINDKWVIGNLADYKNPELKIFNRYGQVVFSSNNYQNNWDGKMNGVPLLPGTYVYLLQIKGANYNLPLFKGTVIILK